MITTTITVTTETYPDKASRLPSDVLVAFMIPDLDALLNLPPDISPVIVVCCCCWRPALFRSLLSLLLSRTAPASFVFSTERSFSCLISPFTCFVATVAAGLFSSCFTDPQSWDFEGYKQKKNPVDLHQHQHSFTSSHLSLSYLNIILHLSCQDGLLEITPPKCHMHFLFLPSYFLHDRKESYDGWSKFN